MYEIRTQAELLLFYQYANADPATWAWLENAKVEHATLGSGTIVGYVPAADSRSDPKIRVHFDAPSSPNADAASKLLALPFLFEKGLLKSIAVPPTVVESFGVFAVQQTQRREASPGRRAEPLTAQKRDWRAFREIMRRHRIENLYHFTDSRNLASIEEHGGLFSWWQCEKRGIKITAPGGTRGSRWRDRRNSLEDYVRLSFNAHQPMMHVTLRDGRVGDLEILRIDPSVIYLKPTLFSNINANDAEARVGGDLESFRRVRFDIATASRWIGESEKRFFQAEVLVKSYVPMDLIRKL